MPNLFHNSTLVPEKSSTPRRRVYSRRRSCFEGPNEGCASVQACSKNPDNIFKRDRPKPPLSSSLERFHSWSASAAVTNCLKSLDPVVRGAAEESVDSCKQNKGKERGERGGG